MSETYRDLGGGIPDPDARPECSWNCDGDGFDRREPDIDHRLPVPCPVHKPHLVGRNVGRRRPGRRLLAF